MKSKYHIHIFCKNTVCIMIHTQKHLSISDHANTFSLSALGRKNITGGSTLKLLASYLRLLKSLKSINKRRRSLKFQGLCPVLAKLIAEHHAHHGIRLADSRDAFAETLKCCLQANHWHPLATFCTISLSRCTYQPPPPLVQPLEVGGLSCCLPPKPVQKQNDQTNIENIRKYQTPKMKWHQGIILA